MRFPKARPGEAINSLSGFPLFSDKPRPNIIAADPWSLLHDLVATDLDRRKARQAGAFINQAYDFYQAARNEMIGSKPLLYYYSFLNLAKMALITSRVPLSASPVHGIWEPGENSRDRSRFEGHRLSLEKPSPRNIFPEFARWLGSPAAISVGQQKKKTIRVIDALRQVPSVHRAFAQVCKSEEILLPIEEVRVMRDSDGVWARIALKRRHLDPNAATKAAIRKSPFKELFPRRVEQPQGGESLRVEDAWFESDLVRGTRRQTRTLISQLANKLWRSDTGGLPLAVILTERGYRYYLTNVSTRSYLHPLVASLAVMFYLGSITRYRPYAFDSALKGRYSWLVWEYVSTAAPQFLYILASHLAKTEVVRPYADVRV